MAEENIRFRFEVDDRTTQRAVERLIQNFKEAEESLDSINASQDKAFRDIAEQADNSAESIKRSGDELGKYESQAKKSEKQQQRLNKSVSSGAGIFGKLADTARDLLGGLVDIAEGIGDVGQNVLDFATNVGTGAKASKGLGLALTAARGAALLVGGAIVAITTGLLSLFARSQSGLDLIEKNTAGVNAVIDVLSDRISSAVDAFGNLLFGAQNFFSFVQNVGQLNEALDFDATIKEARREFFQARQTAGEFQKLRRTEIDLRLEAAKTNREIEALRRAELDESRTIEARIGSLREAIRLEENLAKEQEAVLLERIKLINREIIRRRVIGKTEEENFELLKQLREAQIDLIEVQERANQNVQSDLAAINALQRERLNLLNQLNNLLIQLEDRSAEAVFDTLTTPEQLEAQRVQAVKEIERFYEQILEAAEAANVEVPEAVDNQIQTLLDRTTRDYQTELAEFLDLDPLVEDFITTDERLERETQKVAEFLNANLDNFQNAGEEVDDISAGIAAKIFESFQIDREQQRFIQRSIRSAVRNLSEGFRELNRIQLEQQRQIIESIQERVDTTEEQLERELELQEKGYANDVASLKAKLAEENEELAKAKEKENEIRRRNAKRQLAIDSALQASQLILASARVLNSAAGTGNIFAFIATAVAGIAFLFATIARARAQAQEFAEPPSFRTGGKIERPGQRLTGPSHERGGVLVEAEGGEWVMNRKVSREHDDFLRKLNEGEFHNIDLNKLAGAKDISGKVRAANEVKVEVQAGNQFSAEALERIQRKAINKQTNEIIAYMKSRPVRKLDETGAEIVEWTEGTVKKRHRIKALK